MWHVLCLRFLMEGVCPASGQVMALRLLGRKGFAAYVPHSRLLVVLVVFLQVPSVLKTPGGDLA